MNETRKAAKTIGKLSLSIGIITALYTLCGLILSCFHLINPIDVLSYLLRSGIFNAFAFGQIMGLGVAQIVFGVKFMQSSSYIFGKYLKTITIILLVYFSVLIILRMISTYSSLYFVLVDLTLIILCVISLKKISKYKSLEQKYEESFSTGFQYDESAASDSGNQNFSYIGSENTESKNQPFTYLNEDRSVSAPSKKTCMRCGTDNDSDAWFCTSCGWTKFYKKN